MQKQEIKNVNLVLNSEEGIRPMLSYAGIGILTKDSTGFHFTEKKRCKRIRNIRLAKIDEGNLLMYMQKSGLYKCVVLATSQELTVKGISKKVSALLKQAREGGLI